MGFHRALPGSARRSVGGSCRGLALPGGRGGPGEFCAPDEQECDGDGGQPGEPGDPERPLEPAGERGGRSVARAAADPPGLTCRPSSPAQSAASRRRPARGHRATPRHYRRLAAQGAPAHARLPLVTRFLPAHKAAQVLYPPSATLVDPPTPNRTTISGATPTTGALGTGVSIGNERSTQRRTSSRNPRPARPVRGRPRKANGAHRPSWRPDAVRYMSVDAATQRSTAVHGGTR